MLAFGVVLQEGHHLPQQEFKINIVTRGPVNVPDPGSEKLLVDRDLSFIGSLKISPSRNSDVLALRLNVAGRSNLKSFLLRAIPEVKPPEEGGIGRKGDEILIETRYRFGTNFRGQAKSLWAMDSSNDPGMQWILASTLALVDHQRTHPKVTKFLVSEVDFMRLEAEVVAADFNSTDPFLLKNFKNFRFTISRRESSESFPNYVTGTFILHKGSGKLKELYAVYELGNSPSATEPQSVLRTLLTDVQLRLEDESLAKSMNLG
jgi:hypothetical protein